MKKKVLSIFLAVALTATLSIPVLAAEPVTFDALVEKENLSVFTVSSLTQEFTTMSDDEFDKVIAELTTAATDFELLKDNLNRCGVELASVDKDVHYNTSTRTLDDSDAEIILSAARRAGEDYYHLIVSLSFSWYESYPSSKDGVSLYFDASAAQYMGYNEGNGFRLKSGQQATNGTLVFNFDDSLLTIFDYDESYYGAVYAKPYSSSSVVYGADFAHTFGDSDFNVTGGSVTFSYGPVASGSVTVNFSVTDKESMWQIGALDSF